jgi:hypothetical protein
MAGVHRTRDSTGRNRDRRQPFEEKPRWEDLDSHGVVIYAEEPHWVEPYLTVLEVSGSRAYARQLARVSASQVRWYRGHHTGFAEREAEAEERATAILELEARRRALGLARQVDPKGLPYEDGSDRLLVFLLKANRPEKYREGVKIDVTEQIVAMGLAAGLSRQEALREARIALEGGVQDREEAG